MMHPPSAHASRMRHRAPGRPDASRTWRAARDGPSPCRRCCAKARTCCNATRMTPNDHRLPVPNTRPAMRLHAPWRRLGAALGLVILLAGAGEPVPTATIVTTQTRQALRGWGMSLAWEGNVIYGSPRDTAEITDPAEQARYMDLLYGDPAKGPGLGLNVARYNIGGGDDPAHGPCTRPDRHEVQAGAWIEGFLTEPDGAYDWSRDRSQRRDAARGPGTRRKLVRGVLQLRAVVDDRQRLHLRRRAQRRGQPAPGLRRRLRRLPRHRGGALPHGGGHRLRQHQPAQRAGRRMVGRRRPAGGQLRDPAHAGGGRHGRWRASWRAPASPCPGPRPTTSM